MSAANVRPTGNEMTERRRHTFKMHATAIIAFGRHDLDLLSLSGDLEHLSAVPIHMMNINGCGDKLESTNAISEIRRGDRRR